MPDNVLFEVFLARELFCGLQIMSTALPYLYDTVYALTNFFHLFGHLVSANGSSSQEMDSSRTHASLCGSGMLASTLLISCGPKPVTVLLCFGLEIPGGPTGSWKSPMGAEVLGFLSLPVVVVLVAMVLFQRAILTHTQRYK